MYINETLCLNCRTLKEREDAFCDISLEVKNCESIYESFMQLIAKNKLEGRDQYFCETCNKKVDAEIGTRIQQLPPILTLSLKRFEYDTKTWERVKLTKNYEYPLELDLSEFVHEEAKYELFAVIIHAGTAHSGHYHAYIRDLLKSGKWEPIAKLAEEPKAEIPPDSDSESAHRPKKSRKNKNHQAVTTETIAPNPSEAPKQNLDYEDFPNSCHNPGLLNDWYDFNDSSVTPIKSGKLIKQYGGSHETGYMLIYRNVKLNSNLSLTEIPDYWKTPIRSLNEAHEKHREQYEELKN